MSGVFFQPRESDDMPRWDGADDTQPQPAKPSPCATWGAGAASMASLNSPIFGRKIHPVFPSRKEDLQNSLLQDQRILQPQTPDKFTQEKKTFPKDQLLRAKAVCRQMPGEF